MKLIRVTFQEYTSYMGQPQEEGYGQQPSHHIFPTSHFHSACQYNVLSLSGLKKIKSQSLCLPVAMTFWVSVFVIF